MSKVMIIGGGAAGMMAAIAAAYNGNDVTLFEKNEKLGKKIFITGKGRCNVTNASDIENHFKNIINIVKSFTSSSSFIVISSIYYSYPSLLSSFFSIA